MATIEQIQQQQQQAAAELLKILNNGANLSRQFNKNIQSLIDTTKAADDEFERNLRSRKANNRLEDDIAKAKLEAAKKNKRLEDQLFVELKARRDAARKLYSNVSATNKQLEQLEQKQADLQQQKLDALQRADKAAMDQLDNQIEITKTTKQQLEKQRNNLKAQTKIAQQEVSALNQAVRTAVDNRTKAERDYINDSYGRIARKKAQDYFIGNLKQLFSGALFQKAVTETWNTVEQTMATGAGIAIEDIFKAAKMGLSPTEYIELQAANRQAILAAGGVAKNFDILSASQQKFRGNFATLADNTKYAQQQMTMLGKAGIQPAIANLDLLGDSFKQLQTLTGMTGEQFNTTINDILQDESTQARLRSARSEQERKAIVAGIGARMKENAALGMMPEQVAAIEKSINRLLGQGPIDRIRDAMKRQVAASAMGVSGANEARRIEILGDRATEQQKAFLKDFNSRLNKAFVDSRTGSLSGEIFASQLAKSTGLEDLASPTSEFNTSLNKALAPVPGAMDTLNQASQNLKDAATFLQMLGNSATKNPIVYGTASAIGLAAVAAGKLGLFKGGMPGFGGGFGAGTAGAAGAGGAGAASATSKGLQALGKFASSPGAKLLGGAGVAAGGIYEGYQEYQQTGKMGRAVGAGTGAVAGSIAGGLVGQALIPIPGVGFVIGSAVGGMLGSKLGGAVGDLASGDKQQQAYVDTTKDTNSQIASLIQAITSSSTKSNELLTSINDQVSQLVSINKDLLAAADPSSSGKSSSVRTTSAQKSNDKYYKSSSMTGINGHA